MAEQVHTGIWQEVAEPGNRFATQRAYCRGYDVYGDMLGRARWVDMLWLLFRPELPSAEEAGLLEQIAVALANPGPRDPAVHAAMCSGLGGSPAAASLMAALSVGAGRLGGGQDVLAAMQRWALLPPLGTGLSASDWLRFWREATTKPGANWPQADHLAGFDPNGRGPHGVVAQALAGLAAVSCTPRLTWLVEHQADLESATGVSLTMSGVAAAAFCDLGLTPVQGEMLFLLLRLPGAAAHALEQQESNYQAFPFFKLELLDDPARGGA
ncbi:citryl-CoA lyase [Roseateles sp.]|uniref:citryl-CoA lyase n=1 Tax=Roseateles sp. TaxID=1971397 RepID=UPI0039267506